MHNHPNQALFLHMLKAGFLRSGLLWKVLQTIQHCLKELGIIQTIVPEAGHLLQCSPVSHIKPSKNIVSNSVKQRALT